MKHIDLFSGIGGFSLACEWVGIETILFCECDKFCQKVLKKHWPEVLIIEDVNNVEEIEWIAANKTNEGLARSNKSSLAYAKSRSQLQANQASPVRGSDPWGDIRWGDSLLLTAGFPCQPFSNAGRKRGSADNRYLWPQTLAVIEAVKPDWIILENVPGILNMVFPDSEIGVASQATLFGVENDEICDYSTISGRIDSGLRQAGYETVWLVIPACGVGAPHRRDRVWIVANRKGLHDRRYFGKPKGRQVSESGNSIEQGVTANPTSQQEYPTGTRGLYAVPCGKDSHVADTYGVRSQGGIPGYGSRPEAQGSSTGRSFAGCSGGIPNWQENWYEVATRFCRVPYGFSDWLDKNGGLLNANAAKTITRQDMPSLRDYFQQGEIQRAIGKCFPILTTGDLLAILCKLEGKSDPQDNILFESAAIQENIMRAMSDYGITRYTPSEWELQRQQTREYSNTLSPLSYEIALATESLIWWYKCTTTNKNRVDRLKSLGNAIVPQVAYQLILAILRGEQ